MTGPPGAAEKFGADGRCTDEPARTFVGAQMVALQAWIGTLRRMVAAGCRRPAAGGRAPPARTANPHRGHTRDGDGRTGPLGVTWWAPRRPDCCRDALRRRPRPYSPGRAPAPRRHRP